MQLKEPPPNDALGDYPLALSSGTVVEGLRIESVLGQGSFGITYLAADTVLGSLFALKEYLPRDKATRSGTRQIRPIANNEQAAYIAGLKRFVEEGRTAAPLDHPNVIKVVRCFEANGTAYLQMPYYRGEPLHLLLQRSGRFNADEIAALFWPILDALEYIHSRGVTHRDIKPANIYVTAEGKPILIDFGAARVSSLQGGDTHTAMGSEGYAAREQSSSRGRLGSWTDIYGLSATVYRLVTGEIPVPANDRADELHHGGADPLPHWKEWDAPGHDPTFLAAIYEGLRVRAEDRPQSVPEWRTIFERTAVEVDVGAQGRHPRVLVFSVIAVAALLFVGGIALLMLPDDTPDVPQTAAPVAPSNVNPGQTAEEIAWQQAAAQNSLQAVQEYLSKHPDGTHSTEARARIAALDESAWKDAEAAGTVTAYRDYLAEFPVGAHAGDAELKVKTAEKLAAAPGRVVEANPERAAWDRAKKRGTLQAIDDYLTAFPAGEFTGEAGQVRERLAREEADHQTFAQAQAANTEAAYRRYLELHPSGVHAVQAEAAVKQFSGPGRLIRDCPSCPALVIVPAGAFWQGPPDDDKLALSIERPRHRVTLRKSFAISMHEVTFEEWDACASEGGCKARPKDNWGRGRMPVINVSWNDAQEFLDWLSRKTGQAYRLPSESEWEYAARAGADQAHVADICSEANVAAAETTFEWRYSACSDNVAIGTAPVATFKANKFGLHDAIGNVAEWVQDCMNLNYIDAPADGGAWERGLCSSRITRGGSWFGGIKDARLSARLAVKASERNDFTGFRVVRLVKD